MIISISGKPGSGKSTVAKRLAEHLGYKRYYMGGIRREMALKRGMTLEEYNELGEKDPSTDREVDDYQKRLGETEDRFVIEGRTSFFLIPHSFKIFLDVREDIGAERILGDIAHDATARNEAELEHHTVEEIIALNRKRMASDNLRYEKYYHLGILDPKLYDAWIDTTNLSKEEVFQAVLDALEQKQG